MPRTTKAQAYRKTAEASTIHSGRGYAPFSDMREFGACLKGLPPPDGAVEAKARKRNSSLTKPEGSLGRLEELAIWYASWRLHADPQRLVPQILIFAGNHGVAGRGVSVFPVEVTAQMVANFEAGGAAVNQLAKTAGAGLNVVALQLDRPTADLARCPAMSEEECAAALAAGWEAVDPESELLLVGEMGIGNTTAAAAICMALFGGTADQWVGRGTGVQGAAFARKKRAAEAAMAANGPFGELTGLDILRRLGGRELAAVAGALIQARRLRIPVILDGFVCCAAAACLQRNVAGAIDHTIAGHMSAEAGHALLLERLGKPPLLDLGMRLGEASGAAVAFHILKCALACHSGMATFGEAGVSEG